MDMSETEVMDTFAPPEAATSVPPMEWRSEFFPLDQDTGDTFIYITPPPELLTGSKLDPGYSWALAHSKPHRVHSEKLLKTGSSYFKKVLGPTYQHRIMRKLNMIHSKPPNIKYVIEMSIQPEGDDVALLIAGLSCSKSLLHWHRAYTHFHVGQDLIGGLDDDESFPHPNVRNMVVRGVTISDSLAFHMPRFTTTKKDPAKEFSSVRLHCAIERLLHVIEDRDPLLNSGPKAWSLFCVAKFFDCLPAVQDILISWLRSENNDRFIEVMPEYSIRMAEGFRNQMLCQDAFTLLVGEVSLMSQDTGQSKRIRPTALLEITANPLSPYGRPLDDNLDEFQDSLEYASKAFVERVFTTYNDLVRLEWVDDLFLKSPGGSFKSKSPLINELKARLKIQLKRYIHTQLCWAGTRKPVDSDANLYFHYCLNVKRPITDTLGDKYLKNMFYKIPHAEIAALMQMEMRIFTRSYWDGLRTALCK
jgi:hypothetical protein